MHVCSRWPEVPLKKVLRYVDERVELQDMTEYITITVKRRHGGLGERERLLGHQIKTKKQFRLIPGVFIISRVQCWHQAYAMVPDDVPPNMIASTNYDQFVISPEVDHRFFWWQSHSPSFAEAIRSSAAGVVIEKMVFNRDAWLEKTIALPPLEEQRRIVARIEELAAKIDEAKQMRRQAEDQSEAFVNSVLSGIGKDQSKFLGHLGQGTLSERNGLSRRPSGTESGPIVLRLADVASGAISLKNPRRGNLSGEEVETYELSVGDLLFLRVNGSRDLVGRCIPVYGASETVCFNDHLIRVRLDPNVFDWRFVSIMANGPTAREYIERVAITTAGQNTINHSMLAALPIPVPPLPEQRRIVVYLNGLQAKVDALKGLQNETAAELDALLPSILDKAFKGEL